ncbi:putative membrane protein (plasmid) [Yersinia frederiksenii Y225]|nr:putative membrane protein [Yersinia frederiksenii Y225]
MFDFLIPIILISLCIWSISFFIRSGALKQFDAWLNKITHKATFYFGFLLIVTWLVFLMVLPDSSSMGNSTPEITNQIDKVKYSLSGLRTTSLTLFYYGGLILMALSFIIKIIQKIINIKKR